MAFVYLICPHVLLDIFRVLMFNFLSWLILMCYRVVKEEISDDDARLPCVNGRVVCWVSNTRTWYS